MTFLSVFILTFIKYNIFLIREPKLRIIMSQNITDKIINHLVAKYFLVNVFDKSFIDTNVATRIGRGTHYGLIKVKKCLNEIKFKIYISKYFYNIDHDIVKELIRRKIKDKDVLNIIDSIIDSTDSDYVNFCINKLKEKEINRINNLKISDKEKNLKIEEINNIFLYLYGKGFPIGNMTSQLVAILYLNELNHYIKEILGIKYYVRYMDDGILIHEDINYLKYCLSRIKIILSKYKLNLNFKKTEINSIKKKLDFLGYRFVIRDNKIIMKVRNDCKKALRRKLNY